MRNANPSASVLKQLKQWAGARAAGQPPIPRPGPDGYHARQMQILAVANIKGGVGKTTTAVNLAYLAAAGGRRTVLWDLDPQGAATYTLRGEPNELASAKKLVRGKREPVDLLAPTAYEGLGLVPADASYRNFDVHMSERKQPTARLMRMSQSLRDHCDLLLLDCPPGMSLLTENVLRAADVLVVPVVPAPLSLRMLDELDAFIERTGWTDIRILPFFSMVDGRKSLHAELIAAARARRPSILATELPYWSEIERMSVRRAPLPAFAPRSPAAQLCAELWREIEARLAMD
jgi:cellulose biosynthesis protein BcsQ